MSTTAVDLVWLVGLGLLFGGIGGYFLWTTLSFWRRAEHVTGRVTDLRSRTTVRVGGRDMAVSGQNLWFPLLQFTTHEGRDVETTTWAGAQPMPARPGDELTVLYDPADPTTAALTIWYRLSLAVIFLAVGLTALIVYTVWVLDISVGSQFFVAGIVGGLGLPFTLIGGTTLRMALRVGRSGYVVFGVLFLGIGLFLWCVFGFILVAVGG